MFYVCVFVSVFVLIVGCLTSVICENATNVLEFQTLLKLSFEICLLREKIKHIVDQGKGIPDEDAPHILAETKYWCVVEKKREEGDVMTLEAQADSAVCVDDNFVNMLQHNPMGVDSFTGASAKAILDAALASDEAAAGIVPKQGC